MPSPLLITKADGSMAPFDAEKLTASLRRSGADEDTASQVVQALLPRIVSGLTTHKLYRMAFQLLRKRSRGSAARYRLKQAILDLGPSGFPFERFVGRILEHDGYAVRVGVLVEGRCVQHEVDVVAEKGVQHFLVECKYHNTPGRVCDVKVPLYIKARFDDVAERWRDLPGNGDRFTQGWLVTNTRFTADAMRYGQCAGLRMLSWDQPAQGSLKHRIDRSGLYPLTCLSSLTKAEKERLLAGGLVLVRDVMERPEALSEAMVRAPRVSEVLRDAEALCATLP
ncbi:MAG TPA: restriction endonuclease [Flavobacteriales bacterium]|jgi:hypothetical protein|nr:restriction endonuclease [Flavobacteriales bacterium]HQW86136.1 restriction endonuclease [Flavobacteriales bacterium]